MPKDDISELDIQKHLKEEHQRSPFSEYLKEIVYGGTDGIVTTFAVVAGFSGAELTGAMGSIPLLTVLLFGFANLFADATSMGLGNFLSVRADQDVYRKEQRKEFREIKENTAFEKAETIQILQKRGFTEDQSNTLTDIYMTNEAYWVDLMMRDELNMSNPLKENPFFTGIATFISFIVFGAIPLLPYVFFQDSPDQLFETSIVFAGVALILLGFFRWKITQQDMLKSVIETLLLGAISAIVAYGVGSLFSV